MSDPGKSERMFVAVVYTFMSFVALLFHIFANYDFTYRMC